MHVIFSELKEGSISLRYGENPHEKAWVYGEPAFQLLHEGRRISYNNLLDADAAWAVAQHLKDIAPFGAVALKHQTPCGVAVADTPEEAVRNAIDADAESAYGGILAVNFPFTLSVAKSYKKYLEVIVAPEFTEEALAYLRKKKVRLIVPSRYNAFVGKPAFGALVVSERILPPLEFQLQVGKPISDDVVMDMKLAYVAVEGAKSNAIVIVKNSVTVGIGTGQPSRKRAAWIATTLAGDKAHGAVAASDAFFPFPDGLEILAEAGVSVVVAPLGSKRDNEVLKRAEELGITFYSASSRVFRH
jgi:phosphoribosylaminoimidazolecarboxamide formyltransferase/IMP cyclohydrolase